MQLKMEKALGPAQSVGHFLRIEPTRSDLFLLGILSLDRLGHLVDEHILHGNGWLEFGGFGQSAFGSWDVEL